MEAKACCQTSNSWVAWPSQRTTGTDCYIQIKECYSVGQRLSKAREETSSKVKLRKDLDSQSMTRNSSINYCQYFERLMSKGCSCLLHSHHRCFTKDSNEKPIVDWLC